MKVEAAMNAVVAIGLAIAISGCGGGGGGSNTVSTNQQYLSSASVGEVLTYNLDTTALTYSYTITKSAYGCELASASCHTGSGTLLANPDGTYSPSTSPTSKLNVLPNGVLVGSIKVDLGAGTKDIPILGLKNPIADTASLAGTYNYVSMQCANKSQGVFSGCATSYGSVQIDQVGHFSICQQGDVINSCAGGNAGGSGTLTSNNDGTWNLISNSRTIGYMAALRSTNGQSVGFVDFNDAAIGGYGYGQATLSSYPITTTLADYVGTYFYRSTNPFSPAGTVALTKTTVATGMVADGPYQYSFTADSPWNGMMAVNSTGGTSHAITAGSGVYAYVNPYLNMYEIGVKLANTSSAATVQSSQFAISSPAFTSGSSIPVAYQCTSNGHTGGAQLPQIDLSNIPSGTQSIVMIMDDPQAVYVGGSVYLHEVILVPSVTGTSLSIASSGTSLNATISGSSYTRYSNIAPCNPQASPHIYTWTAYALDTTINGATGTLFNGISSSLLNGANSSSPLTTDVLFSSTYKSHILGSATMSGKL
jgi:phosphatidylethanolamine-binding protein (PEBP) family uncharacterized protein